MRKIFSFQTKIYSPKTFLLEQKINSLLPKQNNPLDSLHDK